MCSIPYRTSDFRSLLESQRDELLKSFRNREAISAAREPDGMDQIVALNEQDLSMRKFTRETAQLREIRVALERLNTGEPPACEECGEKLSAKRLEAVPYARYCVRCAVEAETRS